MSAKSWIKISVGGLITYLILAVICMVMGDHSHVWMFLFGCMLWIVSIFIFTRSTDNDTR